jgi:diacylglycerol kinase
MNKNKNNSFRAAFGNAFLGFNYALKNERNLKIHFSVGSLVIIAGLLVHLAPLEWCIIFLTIVVVIVAELFNTAIEFTVDLASPEKQDMARKAKDISAAAVLVTASSSVAVGLIIFLPKIIALIHLFGK